jgi:hypothetical protein
MKNTIIRSFVLTLAITGFGAATIASHARTTTKAALTPLQSSGGQTLCAPKEPGHCGLD